MNAKAGQISVGRCGEAGQDLWQIQSVKLLEVKLPEAPDTHEEDEKDDGSV